MNQIISKSLLLTTLAFGLLTGSEAGPMRHGIAAGEAGKFCGWPANNGAWSWDDGREILVGYTFGDFVEQKGHNMKGGGEDARGLMSHLARSTDGGLTWTSEDPGNYVGDGQSPVSAPGGIAFQAPGFAMRVVGTGYHGADDENGSFFVSENRGRDWRGPYRFNGLMEDPNLKGKEFTARTAYVVTGPDSCLLFMSSRGSDEAYRDKTFVAETTDGGKTFRFVSWVVPLDDPYRAVMPAVSRLEDGSIVVALRRREHGTDICWVDAYGSGDNGRTWTFLSRVGETGKKNGNPPALVALEDGRLACAYGDRTRAKLYARLSSDGGKTWDEEVVLRDDFQTDTFGDMDFGYPRLAVNHENHIVALYYWATQDRPQHFIAATLWEQGTVPPLEPATVDPALFEGQEYIWAYHLAHLPTVANAVLMEGEHRGFIDIPVWRPKEFNKPFNARVLENHLSLAFFYTTDRPWNPYRGSPALRARLEAVLDFWCSSQNADGLFAEYSPDGWGLSATSFGIKMMGETLRLLDESERAGGPTIDPVLHQRAIAAARRAIEAMLTDPGLLAHAKRYSNQYTGFWGGALAFLSAHPDDSVRSRLTERIREVISGLSSPAGYHYENHGCDWGYTLGTHRNNVRHVWNYAQGTGLGDLIVDMDRPWVEWLAYNAVREPDGSYFTLNRAIETRLTAGGFVTWEFPLAGQIPLARAFAQTGDEHRAGLQAGRQQLLESWPDVGPLTSYAPHVFADQLDRHPWHPTAAERDAAVARLPYMARDHFAHQRADDRHAMSSTFVRRPGYYAAFNAGDMVAAIQRYGLGLVWSPTMGSVLQAQSRDAALWGTAPAGGELFEASAIYPTLQVGGQPVSIEPGARDIPGGETGDVVFAYPLAKDGRKTLAFASDHIAVKVVHPGVFTEHLPLLMRPDDDLVIGTDSVRLQRGDQMLVIALTPGVEAVMEATGVRHGPFQVVRLKLTAAKSLEYRLTFQTVP